MTPPPRRQSSAVVLGASMGGLLAARALTRHFERVTIVEREVLPDGEAVRKGVPQSAHAHGLLASGYRIMDEYFPGYLARVHAVASEDRAVCRRFFDVLNLLAPPAALLSPCMAWRVLARRAPRGESTPWGIKRPGPSTLFLRR